MGSRGGILILMVRSFTVVFQQDEDGYTAIVPALPGLITGGSTLAEARQMAVDAIRCHVEGLLKDGEPIPADTLAGIETVRVELPAA